MRFHMQRRICRATFLLACLVPTLLVGGAAIVANMPAYQHARLAAWQSRLSARLGLDLQFSRCDRFDSSQIILHQLELRDPESQSMLAGARSAIIRLEGPETIVILGQPAIDFRRLPRLVTILHEHLLLRTDMADRSFRVVAPTLLLERESQSESLLDVGFQLDVTADGSEALLAFRPTDADDRERVRLRVVRNRQLDPPATGWELHTGSRGLPCQLARAWVAAVDCLGDDCRFQGSVWAEQRYGGWEIELAGRFEQLELDRLVTEQFPHKLSGMADLSLTQLVLQRSRVLQASGRLESPTGVISRTLVRAAEEHLGLQADSTLDDEMLVRYRDLWLQFSLDERSLVVAGQDDALQTVLAGADGPLLTAQEVAPVAPQAIVKLLVPLSDLEVPAARETAALIHVLPLPPVTPDGAAHARRDYSPLKLRRQ